MEDRLKELQRGKTTETVGTEDIELGLKGKSASTEGEDGEFMNVFFQEVGVIKTSMANVRRNVKQLEEKYVQSLNAISIDQNNKTADEIRQITDATNKSVTDIRARLEDMKNQNKKQFESQKGATTENRVRSNMLGTLTQKFLEVATEYQEVQTNYRNKTQEKMERQFKIAKPDATPEEIKEAAETDNPRFFTDRILDSATTLQAKSALQYVEARHADIKRIEASINQLHQLFLDMAILVEAQGEMLNQIEFNVNQSVAYVKDGTVQLQKAVKLQKKSRKKMYILIVIMVIIVIVILAPVLTKLL